MVFGEDSDNMKFEIEHMVLDVAAAVCLFKQIEDRILLFIFLFTLIYFAYALLLELFCGYITVIGSVILFLSGYTIFIVVLFVTLYHTQVTLNIFITHGLV